MKKIVIVCGIVSGAIVSALMAVELALGSCSSDFKYSELLGYSAMVLAFSLIFVGVKMYRDKHSDGVVSFGKAFRIGLLISLIASTIYVAVWAVEYKYWMPDFLDKYSAHMVTKIKASGMSQDKVDAKLKEMAMYKDMYKNPLFFTLMTYAEILPVGIVISLISALILKRKSVQVAHR
jgi:hypothetical protein